MNPVPQASSLLPFYPTQYEIDDDLIELAGGPCCGGNREFQRGAANSVAKSYVIATGGAALWLRKRDF